MTEQAAGASTTSSDTSDKQRLTATGSNCKILRRVAGRANVAHATRSADAAKQGVSPTIDELADYLKIPKSTLYKLTQEGKVPGQKIGRHWRFRKETIDRWLEQDTLSERSKRGKR